MAGLRNTKWIKSLFLILSVICFLLALVILIMAKHK